MKRYQIILAIIFIQFIVACKKFVEVNPPATQIDAKTIYSQDAKAIAVLTGIYQEMALDGIFQGTNSLSFVAGLSADELRDYNVGSNNEAYLNQIQPANTPFYTRLYGLIYTTNSAIEGLTVSQSLTGTVKQQLLGEAYFMRGFLFFYATNLFGDIPMPLTTNYEVNRKLNKTSQKDVYQQIVSDLVKSKDMLSDKYFLSDLKTETTERIRPSKWAATALLSRVYLYMGKYVEAEKSSSDVISNTNLFDLVALNQVFQKSSKEEIWQVQSIDIQFNTFDAKGFILSSDPNYFQPESMSTSLMAAFEPGDKRRAEWVGSYSNGSDSYYYPYKYKVNAENAPKTEDLSVIRLAEVYLVRAESRAQQDKLAEAISDLNYVRTRSRAVATATVPNPLPNVSTSLSKDQVINYILKEKRIELFSEWGHRWLDLKRSGTIDAVMAIEGLAKGTKWEHYMAIYPFPQDEIVRNPNLTQNIGY